MYLAAKEWQLFQINILFHAFFSERLTRWNTLGGSRPMTVSGHGTTSQRMAGPLFYFSIKGSASHWEIFFSFFLDCLGDRWKTTCDHFLIITKPEILRASEIWGLRAPHENAKRTWTGIECCTRVKGKHEDVGTGGKVQNSLVGSIL